MKRYSIIHIKGKTHVKIKVQNGSQQSPENQIKLIKKRQIIHNQTCRIQKTESKTHEQNRKK